MIKINIKRHDLSRSFISDTTFTNFAFRLNVSDISDHIQPHSDEEIPIRNVKGTTKPAFEGKKPVKHDNTGLRFVANGSQWFRPDKGNHKPLLIIPFSGQNKNSLLQTNCH